MRYLTEWEAQRSGCVPATSSADREVLVDWAKSIINSRRKKDFRASQLLWPAAAPTHRKSRVLFFHDIFVLIILFCQIIYYLLSLDFYST